jgi:hypothetical protein
MTIEETLKRKAEEDINHESGKKSAVVELSATETVEVVEAKVLPTVVEPEAIETVEASTIVAEEPSEVNPVAVDEEMVHMMKLDGLSQKVTKKIIVNHVNELVPLLPGMLPLN